jgi:hypothetical protein
VQSGKAAQEARAEIALGFFHGAFAIAPGAAPHLNSVPVSACYLQGRLRWDAHLDQRLINESLLSPCSGLSFGQVFSSFYSFFNGLLFFTAPISCYFLLLSGDLLLSD